ncbi:Por secretion system C-terminal sorting domain-containing protein [Dyadobacter soli]|uniref:Por secretion system C-terminal sorting domain-containing protein n=1 Tax=Dyadobacter soli TaxID=659014 RepID=A0A1G8CWK9_9BACT|nr:BspA family leucine-rich repeat surface protein [Dyadobacter soli]SDH49350.1 Por secretion system C-terminal sorting domain-containing protein [Dyadobacter soli]
MTKIYILRVVLMDFRVLFAYLLFFNLSGTYSNAQNTSDFVTVWKTDNTIPPILPQSGPNQIVLTTTGINYNIAWEELSNPANNGTAVGSGEHTLTFPTVGTYVIRISPGNGTFNNISFGQFRDAHKLVEVRQWGDIQWESISFIACTRLNITATDAPDLRNVTTLESLFYACLSLSSVPGISNWDVSKVTNMRHAFYGTLLFNEPLAGWDVGNVTDMSEMFVYAAFNQPIGSWNVSSVTNMYAMFQNTSNFNQSLGNWTLSSVQSMNQMLDASAMDCANMATTLEGWATNAGTPNNVMFDAAGIAYGLPAATALAVLRNEKNWTINIGDAVECEALDVSLISFEAKNNNGPIELEWATASESDNDFFEVERSADIRNWDTIGRIKGGGTVNSVRHYALTDLNPLEGKSYYRLKIVDLAGKAEYSHIKAVHITINSTQNVFPNPATNTITILGKMRGQVKIYDLSGREVLRTHIKTERTMIPVDNLLRGTYLIKSENGWDSKFAKD